MSDSKQHSHLKKKALSAVFWNGAENVMRQGLQFCVAVILARILSPEDFGTIALIYFFTGIASVFIDSGFSSALVQQQDTTHTDESTVFWFNIIMSVLVSSILWFSAPFITLFFDVPVISSLIKVIAFSIVMNALGSVQMTLLGKQLNFKILMKIGVISTILSGVVSVLLAIYGYGIWALVFQTITASTVTTILLWLFSSWRPKLEFSMQSLKRLFGFGGYLMLSSILDIIYSRGYSLLIGKFYGVRDLGFYTRADNTKRLPVDLLSYTLSRVAFPIFSAAAHDQEKLRRGAQLALRGLMIINVPMMLGLMVTAENVIYVIFGEKWLPAVPILQVLCIAGAFWPLHMINLNILKAQGHSHLFFRLEVLKKVLGILLLVIAISYGVMGIAWSQVVYGIIGFVINSYYSKQFISYGTISQTIDFLPVMIISIVMAFCVYILGWSLTSPIWLILLLQVILGVFLMWMALKVLRIKAYRDAVDLLSGIR